MTAPADQLAFDYESDEVYKARLLPKLIPLARELASARVDRRLTSSELRKAAKDRGMLTGEEKGRRLSFLHEVFPKAGFKATDVFERSDIGQSHRNLNRVWYLPSPEPHA